MPITHRLRSDVVVLDFVDPLGEGDFKELHGHAVEVLGGAQGRLVLNLSRTSLTDRKAVDHLGRVAKLYFDNSGKLKLASVSPEARRVLDDDGLTVAVNIYDTEDKAIKSFA